jgi:LIVCS family branched-chain amino acid:cation transporter
MPQTNIQKPKVSAIFTGMALFSMFFGAGNLIFPLVVGRSAGTETPYALLGLSLSAVAFPFLGLMAMMLYSGDLKAFLARLGKWPAFVLLLVLQLTQGPLGCMPRLFTLMHASIKFYLPELSLFVFSLCVSGLVFLLTFRPFRIVSMLGNVLTPALLLSMGILVIVGLINTPEPLAATGNSGTHFFEGLKGGYQTMDLILSLLFSGLIVSHLARTTQSLPLSEAKAFIRKKMFVASAIAAALLMGSYMGLCWLSSHYGVACAPEDLLHHIAVRLLGSVGGIVATVVVFLACLTTAISMAAVFSEYVRKDLSQEKISPNGALVITLIATGAVANLGFSGIVNWLGPVLDILYPCLIVLCLYNIGHRVLRPSSQLQNS